MKRCPTCQTEYPDDANWCRFDGGRLQPAPGALTMGWDAQPEPVAAPTNGPHLPQKPGALTMGWDAQPEPAPASGPRLPQKPGALTMGWDAQPEAVAAPTNGPHLPQKPGALTMGWDAQPEPEPAHAPVSPAALAAKSIATSHVPVASPAKSPAATLLGIQAPWQEKAPPAVAAPVVAPAAAEPIVAPPIVAPPIVAPPIVATPSIEVAPSASSSQPAASTERMVADSDLDKPPRNMLPIYAVIGVLVIAAAVVAIVLATA